MHIRISAPLRALSTILLGLLASCTSGHAAEVRLAAGELGWVVQWSPDGKRLAYYVRENRRLVTWIATPDGSDRRRVGEGMPLGWVSGGTELLLAETMGSRESGLAYRRVTLDGRKRGPLIRLPHVDYLFLQPLPGGAGHLMEQVLKGTRDRDCEVWLTDVDGAPQRVVLTTESEPPRARVSPDGRWMAYADHDRLRQATSLRLLELGTGTTRTLDETGLNFAPAWSPDSRQLAYLHANDLNALWDTRLRLLSVVDGRWVEVAQVHMGNDLPRWAHALRLSPDGEYVLYPRCRGEREKRRTTLVARSVAGGREYVIAEGCFWSRTSPDGRWVAVARRRRHLDSLWCVPIDWDRLETREARLTRLKTELAGTDPEAHAAAASALRLSGTPAAVHALETALSSPHGSARAAAAAQLGWLGEEEWNDRLVPLLEDGVPSVRREAALSLARLGDVRCASELAGLLVRGEETEVSAVIAAMRPADRVRPFYRVAHAVIEALGQMERGAAVGALRAIVEHAETPREIRASAGSSLGRLLGEEAVSVLASVLAGEPDQERRLRIVYALGYVESPAAIETLAKLAHHPEASTRCAALEALGTLGVEAEHRAPITRLVLEGTRDADPEVRYAAVQALGRVDGLQSRRAALALLRDPAAEARAKALRLLGDRHGDEEVAAAARRLLTDDNAEVRRAAFGCLRRINADLSLDELSAFVRDKSHGPLRRQEATTALRDFSDERTTALLQELRRDSDRGVRQEAQRALIALAAMQFPTKDERAQLTTGPDPWKSLTLSISVDKQEYVIAESIALTVRLRNETEVPLKLPQLGGGSWCYEGRQWAVETWLQGGPAPGTPTGERVSWMAAFRGPVETLQREESHAARAAYSERRELPPKAEFRLTVDLLTLLAKSGGQQPPLSDAGHYSLRVAFNPRPYLLTEKQRWIASNTASFRVNSLPAGRAAAYLLNERVLGEVRWAHVRDGQRGEWVQSLTARQADGTEHSVACAELRRLEIADRYAEPPAGFSVPYYLELRGTVIENANLGLDAQPFVWEPGGWRVLPLVAGKQQYWIRKQGVQTLIVGGAS